MKSRLAIAAVVIASLLCGCAGTAVALRSTNSHSLPGSAPASGSSSSSAAIALDVTPAALFGLMFLGYFLGGVSDGHHHPGGLETSRAAPEMAESRAIAERDCSRPLGYLEGNLRCR